MRDAEDLLLDAAALALLAARCALRAGRSLITPWSRHSQHDAWRNGYTEGLADCAQRHRPSR